MALINRPFEFVLLKLHAPIEGGTPVGAAKIAETFTPKPEVIYVNGDKSSMRIKAEALAKENPGVKYVICSYNGMVQSEVAVKWDD